MKASAPGRVNIIGEHVDYNDGFVLPFAIDMRVTVKAGRCDRFRFHSGMMGDVELTRLSRTGTWADYVIGVLVKMEEQGHTIPPVELTISSDLPAGMGLSSSAALEVATAMAVSKLLNVEITKGQLLWLTVRAEREFVGVQCGIMDQYTAIFARKGHALLIDTMEVAHRYVPLNTGTHRFYLIDSGVKHELASGEYNRRRLETAEALKVMGKRTYRDVRMEDVQAIRDEILRKRALHVVNEIDRTLRAAKALEVGDMETLGGLLYESHRSLSELYEVSCEETDFIVDFMKKRGAIGARMVGGGFGGGVLVLGRSEAIESAFRELSSEYSSLYGINPGLIRLKSADGAE